MTHPISQMSNFGCVALGLLAGVGHGQSSPIRPQYEVASIKANTSGTPQVRINGVGNNGRLTVINASPRMLITLAYKVKSFQLAGSGPLLNSLDSDRYDIEAKPPEGKFSEAESLAMFQSLLEDRFKLKVHHDTKEMPVYFLLPAKNGVKIEEFKEGSCENYDPNQPALVRSGPGGQLRTFCGNFMIGPSQLFGSKINMAMLSDALSNLLGRTVIDKTGFAGSFNVRLQYASDAVAIAGPNAPAPDPSAPTIFTALQEQLGLRLDSQKGPVEVLVVDHLEKPSEN